MSKKRLYKFQTETDYRKAKSNLFDIPNVSVVVESNKTYVNSIYHSKQKAEAGDIIASHTFEDGTTEMAFIDPVGYDTTSSYWTPEAIVVVPYSHTGDGTVRAMALKTASLTTPSTGSDTAETMYWGREDLTPFYTYCLSFSDYSDQSSSSTYGLGTEANLPCDMGETDYQNSYDTYTYYPTNGLVAPSPYNNDGSKNDAFFSKGSFSSNTDNCLKELGEYDDSIRLSYLQQLDSSLFTTTSINNTQTYYPAFLTCARYSTTLKPYKFDSSISVYKNLKNGNMPWYLPSIGELIFGTVRKKRINYALEKVGSSIYDLSQFYSSTTAFFSSSENVITNQNVWIIMNRQTVNTVELSTRNDLSAVPFCRY